MTIDPPGEIRTARLRLRPWRASDASALAPVLETNATHLDGWIPAHVAAPAPPDRLAFRLAGFADDFAACRAWRFGIFSLDGNDIYGEVDLFFRSAAGRVDLAAADRAEIGYWLRRDVTGRGYATEAAAAMLRLAETIETFSLVEIRCDPANRASAAVPGRLGFTLAHPGSARGVSPAHPEHRVRSGLDHPGGTRDPGPDEESDAMIWIYRFERRRPTAQHVE